DWFGLWSWWEFVMVSCGKEMEAGQYLVRSGDSLVLSPGNRWFQAQIVPV
ncbi:unnamed protein product, partial [Urochloa humidicola]